MCFLRQAICLAGNSTNNALLWQMSFIWICGGNGRNALGSVDVPASTAAVGMLMGAPERFDIVTAQFTPSSQSRKG